MYVYILIFAYRYSKKQVVEEQRHHTADVRKDKANRAAAHKQAEALKIQVSVCVCVVLLFLQTMELFGYAVF